MTVTLKIIAWHGDSNSLFLSDQTGADIEVYNLNLSKGVRTLWVLFFPVEKADFDTCEDLVSQLLVNGPQLQ